MAIKKFHKESSSFVVDYIPEDSIYDTLTQTIYVDLTNQIDINEEEILILLSRNSPQEYWNRQTIDKELNISVAKNLENKTITSTETANYFEKFEQKLNVSNNLRIKDVETENFIKSILNEQST